MSIRVPIIIIALVALIPIATFMMFFMNTVVIGALGWDSDSYLGVYFLLWMLLTALGEAVVIYFAFTILRSRTRGSDSAPPS